jgi:hypothetical protein
MRIRKNIKIVLFCLCIAIAGSLTGSAQIKVLIIGNSQLGVYDGTTGDRIYDLARMIKDLSDSAPSDYPRIEISQKLVDGASLKKHWQMGEGSGTSLAMITTGKWDYVVIQEIYYADKREFKRYAKMFYEEIRKSGAKTILFATAGVTKYYDSSAPPYPEEFVKLNGMQISFGKEKGIPVAAAGYAWMKYLGPNPSEEQILDLYHKDKGHPGYKGSYIYACLLYALITGKNPLGLTCEFKNNIRFNGSIIIGMEEGARMQKAAWDQYLENINK